MYYKLSNRFGQRNHGSEKGHFEKEQNKCIQCLNDKITFFVAKILKSFKNYFVMSIIVDVNHYYCDQLFRQKQKRSEIFILKRMLDL